MSGQGEKTTSTSGFAAENGWFLLVDKVAGAAVRRIRDRILAGKLRTTGLRLGQGTKLMGLAHMQVGSDLSAGNWLWVEAVTTFAGKRYEPRIVIGKNVNLSDNVHIACTNCVMIGDGMLSGSHVIITDHSHGVYDGDDQSDPLVRPVERVLSNHKVVVIGKNVWLGDSVSVLGGAEIGDGAIIGANSVVNSRIPANCIAVGAPARPIRRWDAERRQWVRWTDVVESAGAGCSVAESRAEDGF